MKLETSLLVNQNQMKIRLIAAEHLVIDTLYGWLPIYYCSYKQIYHPKFAI